MKEEEEEKGDEQEEEKEEQEQEVEVLDGARTFLRPLSHLPFILDTSHEFSKRIIDISSYSELQIV